jgi:hypothetical protein
MFWRKLTHQAFFAVDLPLVNVAHLHGACMSAAGTVLIRIK